MKTANPIEIASGSKAALVVATWLGLSIWVAGMGALTLFF